MPPAIVPSIARVAQKWARRAGSAGQEYAEGVAMTPKSWQGATTAATKNYDAGVQAAIGRGAFAKGVNKAGDAKWKRGATEKGPARFAQGVQVAEQDYSGAMAPYLEAIGRVDLPPRGPVGSAGNFARVVAIGTALRNLKVGR